MARAQENPDIEQRIDNEIVVDAYNEHERHVGWMCYLEGRLTFPFEARCAAHVAGSPLERGERVAVTGLLDANEPEEIRVNVRWQGRALAVPLAQLEGVGVSAEAAQAIADWRYWCAQGYRF